MSITPTYCFLRYHTGKKYHDLKTKNKKGRSLSSSSAENLTVETLRIFSVSGLCKSDIIKSRKEGSETSKKTKEMKREEGEEDHEKKKGRSENLSSIFSSFGQPFLRLSSSLQLSLRLLFSGRVRSFLYVMRESVCHIHTIL